MGPWVLMVPIIFFESVCKFLSNQNRHGDVGKKQNINPQLLRFLSSPSLPTSQTCTARFFICFTSSTAQGGGGSFKNRKRIGEIDCCE